MAEIFSGYLKIGFWTAFVIGGALLLLPRLSRRYTAKLPYAVWLVLTLRLLCPVGLSIPEDAVPVQLETLDTGVLWTAGFGTAEPLTQEIHTAQAILPTENEIPSKKQAGFRSLRLWISLRQFGLLAQASLWHGLHGGRSDWHIC